jgi:hypothetical protein
MSDRGPPHALLRAWASKAVRAGRINPRAFAELAALADAMRADDREARKRGERDVSMPRRERHGRALRAYAQNALREGRLNPWVFADLRDLADSIDGGVDRLVVLDAAAIQPTTRRGPASGRRPPQATPAPPRPTSDAVRPDADGLPPPIGPTSQGLHDLAQARRNAQKAGRMAPENGL